MSSSTLQERITDALVTIPNFPKPGIHFRDITPLCADRTLFSDVVQEMRRLSWMADTDVIAGVESRGFIFASAMACGGPYPPLPLALFRKAGKLPRETRSAKFDKEYGFDELHLHLDSVSPKQRVCVVDDILATGGTAHAAETILLGLGCRPFFVFLAEIEKLHGNRLLKSPSTSLVRL